MPLRPEICYHFLSVDAHGAGVTPQGVRRDCEKSIVMRPAHETGDAVPDCAVVRDALARICASEELRGSPQLVAFLSFVVEAVLSGASSGIKAYAIGVQALGRSAGFDPQADPIVRVEATRLRRTLERYYARAGASDPVIIELPRGTYVPSLRCRVAGAPPSSVAARRRFQVAIAGRRWMLWPVAGALLITVGLLVPSVRMEWSQNPAGTSAMQAPNDVTAGRDRGNGMPTLVVSPFGVAGGPGPGVVSAVELHDKLRDAFARFDAVNVLSEMPTVGSVRFVAARSDPHVADFRLDGSVEYVGDAVANLQLRLIDNDEDKLIWTQAFDRVVVARDRPEEIGAVVAKTAATLLQPFGILPSVARARDLSTGSADPRYRCLLAAIDSFRAYSIEDQNHVRSCLQRLTTTDPNLASGFAYLALVYNREFLYGSGTGAENAASRDRALAAARRGVELDPASARAYQILGLILFYRNASPEWQAAAEKSILLNRYDPTISSLYGGLLVAAGEIDRGMALLHRWDDLIVVRPAWEHFSLFLGNYVLGNLAEATHHAEQMTTDGFPGSLVARAVIAGRNGNYQQAQLLRNKLYELQPSWRNGPGRELQKFIPAPFIARQLARDLGVAYPQ
jgi:tetratricopeptide (TPR) repeat protein